MSETPNNPIDQDISQAVQSGNMADTINIGPNQTPTQPAQGQAQPAQPTQSTNGQPQTPKQSLRARIFDTILSAGAGRPVQGPDGKPMPMTRGIMGKAIIANALAGMMAGYGTSETVNTKFGPVRVNNPPKAFAAGAQAGDQQQQQRQQQIDDAQARAFNTLKRNLDLHASMVAAGHADEDTYKQLVSDAAPTLEGLRQFDELNTDPSVPKFVLESGLSGDELMQKYHVAKNNALIDGYRPMVDNDGKPVMTSYGTQGYEPTFTAINPDAIVNMTPGLKAQMSQLNPGMARIPDNMPVKASIILNMVQRNTDMTVAQHVVDTMLQKQADLNGDKSPKNVDIKSEIMKDPVLRRNVQLINKYAGTDPDQMLDGLRKEKNAAGPQVASRLQQLLNIDEDQWKNKRAKELADAKRTADQMLAPTAQVLSFDRDLQAAYPNLTKTQRAMFVRDLGDKPTLGDYQKAQDRAQKQSDTNLRLSQAQADKDAARIAKGEKPVIGVDANNRQVLVPSSDAAKYGLTQVREVGQAENEKVSNARGLMTVFDNKDPEDPGLIQLATKLSDQGKLGPVASRLQDWLNKGGSVPTFDAAGDPDIQRLFTKLGLSTTGLMQVHVGARGSAQMLEHFADLANAKKLSPQAFLAALDTENRYIKMKAMLPPAETASQSGSTKKATAPTPKVNQQNQGMTFDPNAFPKAQ
ncbi:MAG: hypothetical protein WCC04_02035 [Terriglobales bacterium]